VPALAYVLLRRRIVTAMAALPPPRSTDCFDRIENHFDEFEATLLTVHAVVQDMPRRTGGTVISNTWNELTGGARHSATVKSEAAANVSIPGPCSSVCSLATAAESPVLLSAAS
jgi:hypothetical protein